MCNAGIYAWIKKNQFITAVQQRLDNVGVTALDDPALLICNSAPHILNAVLKRTPFHATLKSNFI
jgi:hypothetical protein